MAATPCLAAEPTWTTESLGTDLVRYTTHGTKVWGHKFGFIKLTKACGTDLLWLSLSTYEDVDPIWKGRKVQIALSVAENSIALEPAIVTINLMIPPMKILALSNTLMTPKIYEALTDSDQIEIAVTGPDDFVEIMDVPTEIFTTTGFFEAREEALQQCKRLREPVIPDHPIPRLSHQTTN